GSAELLTTGAQAQVLDVGPPARLAAVVVREPGAHVGAGAHPRLAHGLEPLTRLLDQALDGGGLGSERLADGAVGEPVQLAQDERRALLGGQGVDVRHELAQVAADALAAVAAPAHLAAGLIGSGPPLGL